MSVAGRRRLAAIMFADMAGYTALMQTDEVTARSQRDRFIDSLVAAVLRYHGEILQHFGDGALTVFDSAVEAVEAAVALQKELRREPPVPVRIGVHSAEPPVALRRAQGGSTSQERVQRVNDRIRMNAQLIDAETDTHLWAERFDTVYTVENVPSDVTVALLAMDPVWDTLRDAPRFRTLVGG